MQNFQFFTDAKRLICKSSDLKEGGIAVRFELPDDNGGISCFTIRFDNIAYAYVNRCPHRGTELDWNPGEVFDESGLYLICATHGATFDPQTGECLSGPCQGARLKKLQIEESGNVIRLLQIAQSS